MKKAAAVFAAAMVIANLAACGSDPVQNEVPTTTEASISDTETTTEPQTTAPDGVPAALENLYSVAVPVTTECSYAEDETLVFSFAYPSMHLIHPDRDVVDKIIIDFLGRTEAVRLDAEQLYELALTKDHTAASFSPYYYQIHYNPTRIDQGVLSLHGHISQNADYAHTSVQCVSANYDMVTGDKLTLGSILYRAEVKDTLCNLVITELQQRTDIDLYEDFKESIKRRFQRDESQDEDFYFTNTGLVCYFSPYEIAPYAAGTVTVEIPYHQLTGIIGDAYFPAEQTLTTGTLNVCLFEDAELDAFSQFAEIIVESGNTKLLIYTDGIVQDIQIKQMSTLDNGADVKSETIFAANVITHQEAILIDASFGNEDTQYIVSYSIDGIAHDLRITIDSATGAPALEMIAD